jgi:hypothetical protein
MLDRASDGYCCTAISHERTTGATDGPKSLKGFFGNALPCLATPGRITGTFIRVFRTNAKSPLSKLDFGRSFLPGLSQRESCGQKMATWLNR